MINFLRISSNIYSECSKEPSHRDGSFEYPQRMFWLRNRKNIFLVRTTIWRPVSGKFMFTISDNVDHDKTLHSAVFLLGLHCFAVHRSY